MVAVLVLIFNQCTEEPTTYQFVSDDGRVIATIHGIVQDAQSNQRIASVTIKYVLNGKIKTTTTDTSGYYSISGLTSGDYELVFIGPAGYVTTKLTVTIPTIDQIRGDFPSKEDYNFSVTKNALLYKKNAGLTGMLYARDEKGNLALASGATITVNFNLLGNPVIEPAIFTTTTDDNGRFIFDKNLPALVANVYSLSFTLNGNTFDAAFAGNINLMANVNTKITDLIAQVATEEAKILSSPFNTDDFPVDGNISIIFSKPMNDSGFKASLSEYNTGEKIYCTLTWSDDKTALTIDPYHNLKTSTKYLLILEGNAADNSSFYESGTFQTVTIEEAMIIESPFGMTDFPVDSSISILFSKSMDPSQFEIELRRGSAWGEQLYFETTWSDNNKKVTLEPYVILRSGQQYYLKLVGKDAEGGDFYADGYFTTKAEEYPPFYLLRTNLEIIDGQYDQDFPVNGSIELEFSVPVDTTNTGTYCRLKLYYWPYTEINTQMTLSSQNRLVTVTPTDSLNFNTDYKISFRFYDSNGQYVSDDITFKTEGE